MMRSQDSEVEGVEDDEIVEEVEVEDPESAKHESGGLKWFKSLKEIPRYALDDKDLLSTKINSLGFKSHHSL